MIRMGNGTKRKMPAPSWIALVLTASVGLAGCGFEPDTPLTIAAAAGRTEEVEALLAGGAQVDAKDGEEFTPLVYAAGGGHVETLQVILDHGADPELPAGSNDWTPLVHAIHHHQNLTALTLLEAGARAEGEGGARALLMAAGYGNAGMVKALLERGADPHASSLLLSDAVGGAWDIDYQWPGCEAHTDTVRLLLEAAPDLQIGDGFWAWRALQKAEKRGCTELVHLIEGLEDKTRTSARR